MAFAPKEAPINPLPPVVWALALPIIAMELVLSFGASSLSGDPTGMAWRIQAVERFGFFPHLWQQAWAQGGWIAPEAWRAVTYPLVHGALTSTLFAVVILLALGKMVGEVFRWWAVAVVFLGSAGIGALVYALVLPGPPVPLIGAYPGDYGLIGAFTWLLWMRLAGSGENQYRAFTMIGFLLGAQLLFGLIFGGGHGWIAEVVGFATGFALSFVVSPGGFARVQARLRRR